MNLISLDFIGSDVKTDASSFSSASDKRVFVELLGHAAVCTEAQEHFQLLPLLLRETYNDFACLWAAAVGRAPRQSDLHLQMGALCQ